MAIRILLVEDEQNLAMSIRKGFEENGYSLRTAHDRKSAENEIRKGGYDLVILDRILGPDMDGLDICRDMRRGGDKTPVLILSAMDSVEDKVFGLEEGADDYLSKPFAFTELLTRVRTLIRRCTDTIPAGATLECEGVALDLNHRTATRDGAALNLTPKEFSLLEFFLRNPRKLANRAVLAEKVWDRNLELNTNVIDVYVTFLRKKLNEGGRDNLIHTIRKAGYIFEKRQ